MLVCIWLGIIWRGDILTGLSPWIISVQILRDMYNSRVKMNDFQRNEGLQLGTQAPICGTPSPTGALQL